MRYVRGFIPAMVLWLVAGPASSAPVGAASEAKDILAAAGITGGLVVHVGCGDGKLTAALRANDSIIVQGLATDGADVARARKHIRSLGVYGKVSAATWDGQILPYADNLVNLLVADELGKVATAEVMRVLAPDGVAYIKGRRTVKPRPGDTDEWTHYLHDASGNAVAHDTVVAPPRRVQWIARPLHARSHEHTASINALVSAGGRIVYIADEGPVDSIAQPPRWHLVARDAYNGLLLWKRPFSPWFPHIVNWCQNPPNLNRRLVAVGNRIYVTLGLHAPLTAVDAATGKVLRTYPQTGGTEEVLWHKGILLLLVRKVTDERASELDKMRQLTLRRGSPLHARESAAPLVKRFRAIESGTARTVLALDADTGRLLWKKTGPDVAGLRPMTLSAVADSVVYQKGKDVVCIDLTTGRKLWSTSAAPMRVVCDSSVVCADDRTVTALSAKTGKALWTRPTSLCQIRDAFVINGSLWLGGFKPFQGRTKGKRGPAWGPYFATQHDLATGKILKKIEPKGPGHHHRCYQNKATDRYILGGRRGVEFIDLDKGDVLWHSWVRGVCRYGVMPSNGLLYAPPHACGCYIAAKLDGFHALAGESKSKVEGPKSKPSRIKKGPAYDTIVNRKSSIVNPTDWPTYRHDARRSGSVASGIPTVLSARWQADVGGKLSSLTAAGGKVFVVSVDEHRVCAIDAESGRAAWDFTADGRVDSPPTLQQGRAIFGSNDGRVYCLRASDGALAWRVQAAGDRRYVTVRGQLESASPVHGSVLVRDGVAYCTAGRSSYLDGGIDLYRLQLDTGKIVSKTRIYSPDPKTGRQPDQYGPSNMPGAISDILTADERYVYLRETVFDAQGRRQPKGNAHLLTLTGFLDETWPHRSYWIFGTRCSIAIGCGRRDRNMISGRLLAFDGSTIYGYGRTKLDWSNQLQDGPYRLFAVSHTDRKTRWTKSVPVSVRAMVLAGKVLFVAGSRQGQDGGVLTAFVARDGKKLAEYKLHAPPVWDGMAAAGGRLYVAMTNGKVLCMGKAE